MIGIQAVQIFGNFDKQNFILHYMQRYNTLAIYYIQNVLNLKYNLKQFVIKLTITDTFLNFKYISILASYMQNIKIINDLFGSVASVFACQAML